MIDMAYFGFNEVRLFIISYKLSLIMNKQSSWIK